MPVSPVVIKYAVDGISTSPILFSSLLGSFSADDPVWDRRPEPDRFTLREMVAHLADWDPIFVGRVERTRDEDNPFLASVDEGQLCAERDYAQQSPVENLDRLARSRPKLAELFRSLSESDWDRTAHREFVGDVTMFELAALVLGHDAYHLRQAADYRIR
ncbi:MAG: DinB family protein [Chthonomonadaceae bacterium]|jgi:hypothetical protein|nr:DinB family protein [Chthonomonadaceae bacterium]